MTKEQAQERIRELEAENHGAVAMVFSYDMWQFWLLYVASTPDETFPAWPDSEADDEENRAKWKRLHEALKNARERNIAIHTELRKLYRIAGMDAII